MTATHRAAAFEFEVMEHESPYRAAERHFGDDRDALWGWLEQHRYEHPTLMIGWGVERSRRFMNFDQAMIADRTQTYKDDGSILEPAISHSFVSAMLSGRSKVSPPVYRRLALSMSVNVLDFFTAEGWMDGSDVASYQFPDQEVAYPVVSRILNLPREQRYRAVGVVNAVLDSIVEISAGQPSPLTGPDNRTDPPTKAVRASRARNGTS